MVKYNSHDRHERRELTEKFDKLMYEMDGYGRDYTDKQKAGNVLQSRDQEEKIKRHQKEAKKMLEWQARDNRRKGRHFGDGIDI